jgi:hypothetical protein
MPGGGAPNMPGGGPYPAADHTRARASRERACGAEPGVVLKTAMWFHQLVRIRGWFEGEGVSTSRVSPPQVHSLGG